jgi:two-component system, sensor histidine kinase
VLIEDHDDGREMMAALLRRWGHRVEVAVDGESGIALIERIDPDVVLVDIGLPRQNGYAVTQHVRRRQRGKAPRLVAFTGFADDSHKRRAVEAGFDRYLVKPASLEAIRRALAD